MSALTFATLSAELARALAEQSDIPPAATVRCTTGRDRVLVLVEYPLDSAKAEPLATQTLDWLEQYLRHYFDTTGLPEETADLVASGEAVAVRLYLKHFSEAKPFTMRSFVWKVDDGFDDVFGQPFAEAETAERSVSEPAIEPASLPVGRVEVSDRPDQLSQPIFHAASELAIASAEAADMPDLGLLPEAEEDELILSELEEEYLHLDLEAPGLELDLEPGLESDWEAMIESDELTIDVESVWEADLALPKEPLSEEPFLEEALLEEALPEAAAPSDLSELDLPAIDLPAIDLPTATADEPSEVDFFSLNGAGKEVSLAEQSDMSLAADLEEALEKASKREFSAHEAAHEADGDRLSDDIFAEIGPVDDLKNDDGPASEDAPAADLFDLNLVAPERDDVVNGDRGDRPDSSPSDSSLSDSSLSDSSPSDSSSSDDSPPADGSEEAAPAEAGDPSGYVQLEGMHSEDDMDVEAGYQPEELEPDLESEELESEELESEELESEYGPSAYEYETEEADSEASEEDSDYALKSDGEENHPFEAVALVDEGEVQRQGEQWQQQSQGRNPWIFAGALGFVVVGVLGFVLTRPCNFGQCDRIQVAQTQGDQAIDDLRLNDSLAGVDRSRAQLQGSIQLLEPIPPWSRHYRQAQRILPEYQDQIEALDQVSEAQDKAFRAAVNSQNPPHPVSTWNRVVSDWRTAIQALETVPATSLVGDLAERKLVEYRANLSTIKLRIDAESKAEVNSRQAQQAAVLGTQKAEKASSSEDWEAALTAWETAVNNLKQIPQGTSAYSEAQKLLPDYQKTLEAIRDRTQQERSDSRSLSRAKQLAASAQRAETDQQWTRSGQNWTTAISQLKSISEGTQAHSEAQPLLVLYASALSKAESNLAVALRFQPVEPRFFLACGTTSSQKCTYAVQGGNVRLDLFQGYDSVISQSITPPNQRAEIAPTAQLVSQSNQLLQEITALSTQAQVPVELYDAKGDFLARYQPDLDGFVR